MSATIRGRIVAETGIVDGTLRFDEFIEAIEPGPAGDVIIVPGFIDLHVHGGGGADVMEGADAVRTMARMHGRHGTTTLLATTMTAPPDEVMDALAGIAEAMRLPDRNGAEVVGAHLEGPFISPNKLGAQPNATLGPDLDLLRRLMDICPIKVATLAPDMGASQPIRPDLLSRFITTLTDHGARVQLGHSPCSYETAVDAFDRGASGITHLFNAMSALHHRAPGLVGAALAHAAHGELIPDLLHVHPGAIRVGLRAIPGLYAVTDATAATGMPDGAYALGRHTVRKCDNGVRLPDGTLAGSALTMDRAFVNLVATGLSLDDAARRTATIAADYVGIVDRGRLAAGMLADFVVFDGDLVLQRVYKKGRLVHVNDA